MAEDMQGVLEGIASFDTLHLVDVPPPLIISLAGKKRSGKDSVMLMLNLELTGIEDERSAVLPMSFAAPLKALAKDIYGWTGKKDTIGRWLLQKLGTEKVRAEDENYWVELAERRLKDLLESRVIQPKLIVFTDCRFPNEVDFAKRRGGEVWKVVRVGFDEGVDAVLESHASETALDDYEDWDAVLSASNLDELFEEVKKQIERLRQEGKLVG